MREIPPWILIDFPLPNYVNPVTHGDALVLVNSIFLALVVLAVGLRFYTRIVIKKSFGSDDIFIGLALIATTCLTMIAILGSIRYGWNLHIWDLPFSIIEPAAKIGFAATIAFTIASIFTRTSLLCFYGRMIENSGRKGFRRVIIASQIFVAVSGIVFLAVIIWRCDPISAYWTYYPYATYIRDYRQQCIDKATAELTAGAVNTLADILVNLLPIPVIYKLNMPRRQRIGVIVLLSLGGIATLMGGLRTFYIWKSLVGSWDETWYAYPLFIAATLEIDLAIICACVPALVPLWVKCTTGDRVALFKGKLSEKILGVVASRTTSSQTSHGPSSRSDSSAALTANKEAVFNLVERDALENGTTPERSRQESASVPCSVAPPPPPRMQARAATTKKDPAEEDMDVYEFLKQLPRA